MSDTEFDLVVIGGGPGGYVCAIRAAQLGMRVACVERRKALGGTCLNVGCIPSKALLHSSHLLEQAEQEFAAHGIRASGLEIDLEALMARKDKVVGDLTKGIAFLFRKYGVEHVEGHGRITAPGRVVVEGGDGSNRELATRHLVIATGSEPASLPGIAIDEERVLSSTGALALDAVPGHLVVVGAGYIGLELGTVWRRLGARVTVVEFLDRVTPGMDLEISRQMQRILKRQGMRFRLGSKVEAVAEKEDGLEVTVAPAAGGEAETIAADRVLIAVGRRPHSADLGLGAIGLALDEQGRIPVDEHCRTTVEGVWAIGDVVRGPMLAHKAMEEGHAVAEALAGQKPHVNYEVIPGVVYTEPEAASVGRTEQELKEAGIAYRVGKFPFSANSRARCTGAAEGFVKILAETGTDRVLGAHILGPDAGTLIAEIAMAMEFGASSEDIARTCHAHPTLEEAIKEAAWAAFDKPVHI